MLAVSSQSAVYFYKDVVDCRLNVNNEKYSEQFPSHIFTKYKNTLRYKDFSFYALSFQDSTTPTLTYKRLILDKHKLKTVSKYDELMSDMLIYSNMNQSHYDFC